MTALNGTIISGLPVDSPETRKRLADLGLSVGDEWPVPYKDSLKGTCEECESPIWIGPVTAKTRDTLTEAGKAVSVLCLICCAVIGRRDGLEMNVIQLTDKKAGE